MAGKNKWSRVSILTALLNEIETLINNNPQLGYNSASSFVNDALRRLLEKCQERTGESEAEKPQNYTMNQETLKTFWRQMVTSAIKELNINISSKDMDQIINALIEKLKL